MADELNKEEQKEVDPFEKHIDIAIEAQDGKAEDKSSEDANAESGKTDEGVDKVEQRKDSESAVSDDKSQQQPSKEGQKEAKHSHGAKDLVLRGAGENGADLVIRGGAERRFYEQRETARARAKELEDEIRTKDQGFRQLQEKYEGLEQTVKGLHGADPATVSVGLKIVNDLQRDPVGTMKKLLAEVTAQGYKIEDIGAGVDHAAIQRMIEERLPKSTTSDSDDIAAITEEAEAEATTFFASHPDAKPHDALLAAVLRDHPELSLSAAYYQVKEAFIDKGFDWSLSLEENLKQSGLGKEGKQDDPNNKSNGSGTTPLPSGGNGAGADLVVRGSDLASESADTGDIVREAMREAGYKV